MVRVAIVEDDKTMLSLLHTLMEFEGYQVVELDNLHNLERVIETLRKEKPDLLLLDMHLDQYDGFQLLRSLRKDEELNAIRILASSGRELSQESSQEGADGFILKPYMPQDLMDKLHQILGK